METVRARSGFVESPEVLAELQKYVDRPMWRTTSDVHHGDVRHTHPGRRVGRRQESIMYSLLNHSVHQQLASDRRHRFVGVAAGNLRRRTPLAPDLIRTADLGVFPTAILPHAVSAERIGSAAAA